MALPLGRLGARMQTRRQQMAGGVVATAGLAAALALLGLVYVGFVLWPRHLSAVPPDAPSVPITVAGVVFNVPPAAMRVPIQRSMRRCTVTKRHSLTKQPNWRSRMG